ncbi:MAG: 1-acyl-sn-glycerol-3-phosphate acyltransferase [Chloroflexi bacterium]|nr:1-acyl-sn-glycerol-3-phosphate acyltransferase [Chloroflexota bacterium]
MRRFLLWFAGKLLRFGMVLRVEGLEHLPLDGPVVIAANHVANLDVFLMQFAVPRTICFMGKVELFNTPLDPILRVLCVFPVHRGEKDEWAFRHAAKVLAGGGVLGMFPEGKSSNGRGLGVAKTGTARMALEMNSPIIPLTVVGSDHVFRQFPGRSAVTVRLLPAILPNPGETPLSLTDRLMFSLASALPEGMRGVYAKVPKGFG